MTIMNVNFNDVPDVVPEQTQIESGVYQLEIWKAPELKPTKKDPNTNNLVVYLMILDDGDFQARKIQESIYLGNDFGKVKAKNFIQSAGFDPDDGFDLDTLVNSVVTGSVVPNNYKSNSDVNDDGSARMIHSNKVSRFIVKKD